MTESVPRTPITGKRALAAYTGGENREASKPLEEIPRQIHAFHATPNIGYTI
jgi:hypothetical protein